MSAITAKQNIAAGNLKAPVVEIPPACCTPVKPAAAYIEAGRGETVILLHGSAGSSALWRRTLEALQPLYHVIAPDLIGYGGSMSWPADVPFDLGAETRNLQTLLPCCGGKYHLAGYSYGGMAALYLALADPRRVLTLTLVEPVFFAALRHAGETDAHNVFCHAYDGFKATLARGERELAMQYFIDFWTGNGSWEALDTAARASMLKMGDKIVLDWGASITADPDRDRVAALGPLTMLVRGSDSPEPMCRLVDSMHALMPGSERIIVPGANHLLPLSHSPALTSAIMAHLLAGARRQMRRSEATDPSADERPEIQ